MGWKYLTLVRLSPLTGRKHQRPHTYTLISNPQNLKPVTPTLKPQTSHPTSGPHFPTIQTLDPFSPKKVGWKHLTLVRLSPLTGRKHQLRRHMAALGHPMLGDRCTHTLTPHT